MKAADSMVKWMQRHEGKDLINCASDFKRTFNVTNHQMYDLWKEMGYV
jgi:hypothetical protein